jgi:MFS family permease
MATERRTEPAARADGGARSVDRGESRHVAGIDRERQHEEFGGFNWGASFFGWLVAVGITALLTALLSAAGAAIGLTELSGSEARSSAETISLVGGALLIAVLAIGYYAGGYVAGRMSRFDGGRQGLGVWLIGLVVTILLAVLGAVAGSEYNLLGQLDLPRIPIDEGSLATGAVVALAIMLVATVLAAISGGKVGERYHRKVDRVGLARD